MLRPDPQSSHSRTKTTPPDSSELEDTTLECGSRDGEQRRGSRRLRNNRTSSTFFLESSLIPARRPEPGYDGGIILSRASSASQRKGKWTSNESASVVPKRHATVNYKYKKSPVGVPPPVTPMTNVSHREEASRDGAPRMPSDTSSSTASTHPPQSIGLDTDPAQIVNLALNLSDSRRRCSTANSSVSARTAGSRGREYNPLQYIRNRKVRFREKCPIDSEADGWDNPERVRSWVDLITGSDENPNHRSEDCVLLPKFDSDDRPGNRAQSVTSTTNATRVHSGGDSSKPRRPRIDWITSPADFIADAAWLEEGSNKLKIENRDGKRLFSPDTRLRRIPLRGLESSTEQPAPTTEKSEGDHIQVTKKPSTHESLPSFKSVFSHAHTGADRGRARHKIKSPVQLSPRRSPSIEASKSRWRKALSRTSDSSSESGDDEQEKHRGRKRFPRLSRRPIENENLIGSPVQKIPGSSDKASRKLTSSSTIPHNVSDAQIGDDALSSRNNAQPHILPFLDTPLGQERHIPPPGNNVGSSSSSMIERRKDDIPRSSIGTVDGSLGLASNRQENPNIALNLSPPESRPSSPTKPFSSRLVDLGNRLSYTKTNGGSSGVVPVDHDAPELPPHKHVSAPDVPLFNSVTQLALDHHEDRARASDIHHPSSPPQINKNQMQQESRLRGIFKPARLAELVGSEVSKVGDYIWKKDISGHSRQSSTASSEVFSDYVDADDNFPEAKRKQKLHLSRFPILSESPGLSRMNSKKDLPKYHAPNLPAFASPPKHDDQGESQPLCEVDISAQSDIKSQPLEDESANVSHNDNLLNPFTPCCDMGNSSFREGRNSFVGSVGSNKNNNNHLSLQVSRDQLPVTGLTNLTVTPTGQLRPTMSVATRNWSISRSIDGPYLIDRREIARALEICRQADMIRDSPPVLVFSTEHGLGGNVPRVPRSEEVTTAARSLMFKFDREVCQVQHAMSKFSSSTSPSLKSRLDDLDSLVTSTLNPRIRDLTSEDDKLTSELATTNTLALKQLNDSLDKGLRKRKRRFRWISRVGFVMLEWVLVGAMWWLWLVVMIFKMLEACGGVPFRALDGFYGYKF
ncbi:predicted protein [Histoplasma mississippiense (nom. inval.)]|uniref:predicted protein n=1 Tax=Ajellomyces capsulatus (strain NAm1 / WU24) TaxID=2059318 RepID=UPI000157CE8D|nr:predicted protein [Histoplasma mississippiense (nom. inval.)]EDN10461.1 predicted protein [Histoplasma mississippiense (nom. inval.)]